MTGLKRYPGHWLPSWVTLLALPVGGGCRRSRCNPQPQAPAQDAPAATPSNSPAAPERWNWFYQATSIGDYHGAFSALYSGPSACSTNPEHDVSLTTTLFLGFRPFANTQIYFDPEIAGGRGFSGVNGIANAPNGELPRVASATPKPYLARLYVTQDFGFGTETRELESDENQLAGIAPHDALHHHRGTLHRHRFFR